MDGDATGPPAARRVRAYWRTRGVLARLPRGLPTVLTGAWLGVLRPRDVHALDRLWYGTQLERYGTSEYVRSGLFPWEEAAVAAHFPAEGRVLVGAAGAGREMLALHRRGYRVDGFECNAGLRERAAGPFAAAGLAATVRAAEHDRCPPLDGPYDAAVVGWSAYMFIPTRGRRVAFLRELRDALVPGAPVLLSFRVRGGTTARDRVTAATANVLRRARRAEPARPGDGLEPFFVHRFTARELAEELETAGFALVAFAADSASAVARARPLPPA
ncbi:class I SAM-dependent methyltransferase [Patulibacter sp. SYSU D01012]|uniref:class I SAM-dependent methyltransferase n=1 Tax=Patulibacter sp. SYSU D01012 TaxID=2817381 RepID=UPI001B304587|nr:class I SAM-dependent methyltransferase [Patulibacter sp. SYSU D01012]